MQKINLFKKNFSFPFFSLISFLIFFILSPSSAFAFAEEFSNNSLDETVWESYLNEGKINIDSGVASLSAENTTTFPFIHSKVNLIPSLEDFSVKFRMKYNEVSGKGTGLVLSTTIPQNGIGDTPLNSPLFSQRHFLELWQDSKLGFFFAYSGDCYNKSCSLGQVLVYQKGTTDLNYHDVEFQYSNQRYSIFLDGNDVFTSNPTQVRPTMLWFGNYTLQPSGYWTEFEVDYIKVSSLSTITPTPTPTVLQPLILLPGFGGSWNHENMILGIDKPQSEWYMTPGIKVYDGLIETLKNAGYEIEGENKNIFIFNYDWTKPVSLISEDLKRYIETVVKPSSEEKIDLLGHSLGGLVARTYVQNNQENPVDQLITLGSPHQGILSVYYLWEGGNLGKFLPGWQKIGVSLLLYLRKPCFATNMEAIREIVPSLKNLLPTFNYLKNDSREINLNSMNQKNDWLIALNNSLPEHLVSILSPLIGKIPANSLRWINIGSLNWLDKILGLWVDGKPENEELADGDGTVLTESGSLNGVNTIDLENVGHQELVTSNKGQQKIVEVLGLNPTPISDISTNLDYNSSLVFQIASPATITITDPNGNSVGDGDGKLMIINNPLPGKYQINLSGIVSGPYDLYIGQILDDKDFWTTTSGLINEGDEISYKINFNPSAPLENPIIDQTSNSYIKTAQNQILNLREEIKQKSFPRFMRRLILIQLNRVEFLLKKERFEKTITSLYRFRLTINFWQRIGKLDKNKSLYLKNKAQKIIDNLEMAYIISKTNQQKVYNQRRLKREIILAQKIFEKMENKLQKLSKKGVVNPDYGALYILSLEKLNKAKNSTSYEAHINTLAAKLLSQEGFFFFK